MEFKWNIKIVHSWDALYFLWGKWDISLLSYWDKIFAERVCPILSLFFFYEEYNFCDWASQVKLIFQVWPESEYLGNIARWMISLPINFVLSLNMNLAVTATWPIMILKIISSVTTGVLSPSLHYSLSRIIAVRKANIYWL